MQKVRQQRASTKISKQIARVKSMGKDSPNHHPQDQAGPKLRHWHRDKTNVQLQRPKLGLKYNTGVEPMRCRCKQSGLQN